MTLQKLYGRILTRSVTPEQINANQGNPGGLSRRAEIREVDAEKRSVELAFSSETPVERWFGEEILDHNPASIRTERLKSGGAVLVNHDWGDQIGVVESVSIDSDRRGRAVVRFGKSSRAEEIFQDVVDGIRKHVSVGYTVHKAEVEERKGMPDLVRIIDWEPYEISVVTVPADMTVGIGREMEITPEEPDTSAEDTDGKRGNSTEGSYAMKEKVLRDAKGNLVRAMVDDEGNIVEVLETIEKAGEERRHGTSAERDRVRAITEMGEQYGVEDLARDAVKDDTTCEQFQKKVLEHLNEERAAPQSQDSEIGMSDEEVGKFSFMRAVRALANPNDRKIQEAAAFEYEASRAAAERMGRDPQGIMVPIDVLSRALTTSTDGVNAGETGGYSISTDLLSQSFIEMLRNRAVIMQLGRVMGGLVGNIQIPRQSEGATGYWIGEDNDAPEDNLELDQIGMTPKTVAALSEATRKLLMQSSLDVEALMRSDLATALALTIDKAGFYGTGSDNQPLGIVNTTGINAVGFDVVNPTYAEIVQMESEIAADNAATDSMAYVGNSKMRGHLKTTQKFQGTNGSPVWEQGDTVNGYRTEITNQVNNGDLLFGNFSDLLIGMWGGLDLTVDPYTHSAKGRIRIVAMQDVDYVLRRTESFCLGRKAV